MDWLTAAVESPGLLAASLLALELIVQFGTMVRIIMRRRDIGSTLAWIFVVMAMPVVGVVMYLLFGELRIAQRRRRVDSLLGQPDIRDWFLDVTERYGDDGEKHVEMALRPLCQLADDVAFFPALTGNAWELITEAEDVFARLIADIDAAQVSCDLEFYIWYPGGRPDDVAAALLRAAQRGVTCRLLVDALGSRKFLKSPWRQALIDGGVEVRASLPLDIWRSVVSRLDLRNHRKLTVIDGSVGYTGSLNMADPKFFKRDAGFGAWIDAMVRLQGPIVEALSVLFLQDWAMENKEGAPTLPKGAIRPQLPHGDACLQLVPSGPLVEDEGIREVLLSSIYAARHELILTTPYFIPDDSLVQALRSATRRGVSVKLILPERVDSILVRLASQAYLADLVAANVQVYLYHGGLLHTKSITVDDSISHFGSLNLDLRSLNLNFEITLSFYDAAFTQRLRVLQREYLRSSRRLRQEFFDRRSRVRMLVDNTARLLSPLL